jgi:DNA-binding GntR family transcriptional regulator
MAQKMQMNPIESNRQPSVATQAFDALLDQILTCALPPGIKISEAEVARQMGVSRQPVREAFYRLSKLDFLLIRPQRATEVRRISSTKVREAMYIRRALETEVVAVAAKTLDQSSLERIAALLDRQQDAVNDGENILFHQLDDMFHKAICNATSKGFVWSLIKENKVHMDRVRHLTLSFGAAVSLDQHRALFTAIKAQDPDVAVAQIRSHLSRIESDLPRIRAQHSQYFVEGDE